MLDIFAGWRKSNEEKRQEAITAYLDDALTPKQRRLFEEEMAVDPALRQDVEQQRFLKRNLAQIPRLRAPRNFTLDPALYGRPQAEPGVRLFPALRAVTVLTGFFFVVAVAALFLTTSQAGQQTIALESVADESASSFSATVVVDSEGVAREGPARIVISPDESTLDLEAEVEAEPIVEAPAEEIVVEEMAEAELEADIQTEGEVNATIVEDSSGIQEAAPQIEMTRGLGQAAPLPEAEEPSAGDADIQTPTIIAETTLEATPSLMLSQEALSAPRKSEIPLETATIPADELAAAVKAEEPSQPVGEQAADTEISEAGGPAGQLLLLSILVVFLGIMVILLTAATILVHRRL